MEWIETLAKRQGADPEELTTRAGMNIPVLDDAEVEAEDYQPFSFDTPPSARRAPEAQGLENPADWLNSLAGSEGYSEEGVRATQPSSDEPDMSLDDIQDAINAGTVTREQMQYFLDQQADQLVQEPEVFEQAFEADYEAQDDELDFEESIAPAELPDWLSELNPQTSTPEPTQPIDSLFEAEIPQPAGDMPDWLREDLLDEESSNLDSIFASTDEDEQAASIEGVVMSPGEGLAYEIEVDADDPWVEAFDLEYEQGAIDVDDIPDWYSQNLSDPERIASVEGQGEFDEEWQGQSALADAALPAERDLSAGQPEAIPSWASDFASTEHEEVEASSGESVFAEMPDWLREVEASVSPDDIPDWLVETISAPIESEPEAPMVIARPAPEPTPAPPVQMPVKMPVQPAAGVPVPTPPQSAPVYAAVGEASEVLERARDKEQNGDLEGALADYEGMIRVNSDLDSVIADLSQLVKSYKTTPAVYRVLGDGLMRQGKLQAALNTYREALNQL